DLHRDQTDARRHTLHPAVGGRPGTGDQAGDEGAVPVAVEVVAFRREVDTAHHLAGQVADGVDTGIDDGHADAVAGVALVPRLRRPHGLGVHGAGDAAGF